MDTPDTRTYPPRPIIGVGGVVLLDDDVVLVKRRFDPLAGQWTLPGGVLEIGEKLAAGVAREVLEETGLVVEVGPLVDVFERIMLDEQQRVRYHYVLIDYLCRKTGGSLQPGSDVDDVVLAAAGTLADYRLTWEATDAIAKARGISLGLSWCR